MLQDHLATSCAFSFGAEEGELLLNCFVILHTCSWRACRKIDSIANQLQQIEPK